MNTIVMDTNTLPLFIKEKFHTQKITKVTMQERDDGGIILLPLRDIRNSRGISKGSAFTTEKLYEYRREEKDFEIREVKK